VPNTFCLLGLIRLTFLIIMSISQIEINKNKWYFYENINLMKEKKFETYFGSVYILEYKNGKIKIGKSSNPVKRLKNLIRHSNVYSGKDYSIVKILVSEPHTNYNQNEKILHNFFKDFHLNGEVFNISLNKAINLLHSLKIDFLDEKVRLGNKSKENFEKIKQFFDCSQGVKTASQYTYSGQEKEFLIKARNILCDKIPIILNKLMNNSGTFDEYQYICNIVIETQILQDKELIKLKEKNAKLKMQLSKSSLL